MKKEKRADSSGDEESGCRREDVSAAKIGEKRPHPENDDLKPSSSPERKDLSSSSNKQVAVKTDIERFSTEPDSMTSSLSQREQKDELEFAKAEMGDVREENQRLKMHLNRIMKDYQKLQMQFHDIVGQDHAKKSPVNNNLRSEAAVDQEPADELVSLTLGRCSNDSSKKDDHKNKTSTSGQGKLLLEEAVKEGLSLGLDNYNKLYEAPKSDVDDEPLPNQISPANSSQEPKEEDTWPPSKVLKTNRSDQDDEVLQQNSAKKARVRVRARCDTPTMNDGCQWRKYGQKIAKGNPCPRAYYRCTVAPSCPVRKQVQRCAEDMSILITTYEGTHNHQLPMSATAMASTTSAAASMLLSGSSSSTANNVQSSTAANSNITINNIPPNLQGLNFYLSDNSKSKFYLPNSSLSAATSHPTITLDLTSSSSFPFNNRFSSAYNINTAPAKYTSGGSTLSFGSSDQTNTLSWSNGLFSYGGNGSGSTQPYINMRNQIGALNYIGRVPSTTNVESSNSIYQSFLMQKNNNNVNNPPPTQPADPIAAATKAITADPNFQSALAAALTSIIGNNNNNNGGATSQTSAAGDQRIMGALAQVLNNKWGSDQVQPFPVSSSSASASHSQTVKGNIFGCASSFLKMSSTTSTPSQPGSLMFLPSNSLPFSTAPKSTSASPEDAKLSN